MIATRTLTLALLVAALAALAAPARAAVFPDDADYHPLHCGGGVMTDPAADDPAALTTRDIVGNATAPAGFRASDATDLFLRIRLDADPAPAGMLAAASWGMAFDTDADPMTYEVLVLADGTGPAAMVNVFANTTTITRNDPTDPADTPPRASYPFTTAGRSVSAPGNGGSPDADFYLDIAVPWADMIALGIDHDTPVRVWVASSSAANALNGDFACSNRGAGPVRLDGAASDDTTGDPANDPDEGGGGGGNPPNGELHLEGGGGCAAGGGTPGAACALLLLGALRARPRSRRR